MPYRLAAPPEPWVDRPAEEAWLAEALGRGPVAALVGPRGAGKTALARRVLPARYPDRPKVAVSLSGPDATLVVLHALAEACGVAQVAWADLQGDALLAAIVDLAEEAEAVVVLEGADAPDARPLLAAVARYARRSRWLALAERSAALPALPGQVRRVEALSGAIAPAPLDALSPAQRELVALVRALGRPLPAAWLTSLGVADADAAALREAGWLVREADAWAPSARAEEERLPLAEPEGWVDRLGALDPPDAHHAAVALALGARRPDAAARVLEVRGAALLRHRALEALWPSLARRPERSLWRWRARAALALGDRERLAQLTLPDAATRQERLAWAEVLRARRALEEAASEAAALGEEAEAAGEEALAFEAGMVAGRALLGLGRPAAVAGALHPPGGDRGRALRRDALLQLAEVGRGVSAPEPLAALARALLEEEGAAEVPEAALDLAFACYGAGRLEEARRLTERLTGGGAGSAALFGARRAVMLRVALAVLEGRLEEAARLLARLKPYATPGEALDVWRRLAEALLRTLSGELAGMDAELEAALAEARRLAAPETSALAGAIEARWAALTAKEGPVEAWPGEHRARADLQLFALLERAQLRARRGEALGMPKLDARVHAGLRALAAAARGVAALVAGDARGAWREAEAGFAEADEAGHAVRALECLRVACEARLVAGEWDALERSARALEERAAAIGSARFVEEARFFRAVAKGPLAPASLERWGAREEVAPRLARRARALLGVDVPMDAVDRAMHAALEAQGVAPGVETVRPAAAWVPGWGVDALRRVLWLPDGTEVDLRRRGLALRLLGALADRGGEATKEELVIAVWGEEEYHPIRHDNRLHSAVRKLRKLLEVDPAEPVRLVTTEEGYALGPGARRVRA